MLKNYKTIAIGSSVSLLIVGAIYLIRKNLNNRQNNQKKSNFFSKLNKK